MYVPRGGLDAHREDSSVGTVFWTYGASQVVWFRTHGAWGDLACDLLFYVFDRRPDRRRPRVDRASSAFQTEAMRSVDLLGAGTVVACIASANG